MPDRTDFAHLTRYDPSDPISADGYSLQDRNVRLLDYYLRLLWNQRGDGHTALVDPATVPDATVDPAGGQIPSDLTLSVGYTLLDQDGGETALSPLAVVATPAGLAAPDDFPTLTLDTSAGTLLANTYTYAVTLTDGNGGETALGPSAMLVIPSGSPTNSIVIDGLDLLLAGGAVGWRLWRSIGGEDFHLIAQGAGASVTDDGSLAADCGVAPPSITGTTNATAVLNVTVPAGQPADTAQYRVYVAIDGDFSGPSLLGTYPAAELNTLRTYTELAFLGSSPPEDSTTMPAAAGGGGGGGGTSYPADYTAAFTTGMVTSLDASRVLLGTGGVALLREGTGEWAWGGGILRSDNDSSDDAGHVEHPVGFFAGDAPGMRDGHATVRFQLDAVNDPNFLGNVAAFIGHRDGPRFYARVSWDGAGVYYIDAGTEDLITDNDSEGVTYANATLALAVDTDYWLRVTHTGGQIGGALYDEDPDANPAAVALLVAPLTDDSNYSAAWNPALRTNGLPGFGWSYTDDTNRSNLIRAYGLTAHAESGGDGYDPLVASRISLLDDGSWFSPVRELEFVGCTVVDQRPKFDRITVTPTAGGAAGPPGINPPAPWDPATNYVARDTATRNGSFYYALAPSLNVDPATDDGTHWIVLAIKGADGADGADGAPGAAGADGVIAVVQDESSALAAHSKLNFLGAGVTVTPNAGNDSYDVAIPGGGGGSAPMIDEDFTALPAFSYGVGAATDLSVAGGTMKSATQNEVQAWLPPTAIDSRQIVRVKAGTGGAITASPLARRIDDNNFLMMGFYGNGGTAAIQMYARDAGAWVAVGAQVSGIAIVAGAWYYVVFRVIGNTGKMRGEVWDIDPRKDPDRAMLAPIASTTVTLATAQNTKFAGVNGKCGLRNDPASAGGGANALTYELDWWKAISLDAPGNDF